MNQSTTSKSRLRTMIVRVTDRAIAWMVPKHIRRAIFACSLAARLSPNGSSQHSALAQTLCKDLDLVCAYNAMLAPMSWNSRIWQGLPDIQLPDQAKGSELIRVANEVMRHVPSRLVYSSPRIMLEDTVNTLRALVRDRAANAHSFV